MDDSGYEEAPARPPRRHSSSAKKKPKKTGLSPGMRTGILAGSIIGFAVLALLVFLFARGNGAANLAAGGPSVEAPATVNTGEPITDEECLDYAQKLESAALDGDAWTFEQMVNYPAMIDKGMAGIEVSAKFRNDFRTGALASVPKLTSQILSPLQDGSGSYQYLRTMESNGMKQVLFRLDTEQGLNYHRFDLTRNPGGNVVAGDMYVFLSGEYFSTTLRRLYLPAAAHESRSLIDRLAGSEHALVANLDKFVAVQQAMHTGQHQQALTIYGTLPPELQREKFMLLMRIQSASQVGNQQYLACLEDFQKYHPNDVYLDFLLIDYHTLKQNFPQAHAAIDRLDNALGGDPYLKTTRAGILLLEGRVADARKIVSPLLEDKRFAENGHTSMLDIEIAAKDNAATLATLRTLRNDFGYQFGDLTTVPAFADFVKSTEYQQWISGG